MPLRKAVVWWIAVLAILRTASIGAADGRNSPSDYIIRNYDSDDGLRSDTVFSLTQDRDGYLWCGTYAGLARFDGVRFTIFDIDKTRALGTRTIYSVQTDRAGRLWIGNDEYALIVREAGEFHTVPLPLDATGVPGQLRSLCQDSQGCVWITTRDGRTMQWKDGQLTEPKRSAGSPSILLDWSGSGPDWFSVSDPGANTVRFGHFRGGVFTAAEDPQGVEHFYAQVCFPRIAGGLWMLDQAGEDHRLRSLLPDGTISGSRTLPPLGGDPPSAYLEDYSGNLWIGLREAGILRFAPDGSRRRFTRADGLPSERIRSMILDREGNIWAATDGGGLTRFSPRRFQMAGIADGLPSEIIYALTPASPSSGGGLWVATHGGGVVRMIDGRFQREPGFDSFPWTVHVDAEGLLWVGDLSNGLGVLRKGQGEQLISGQRVAALCDDPAGGGWAGGDHLLRWGDGRAAVDPSTPIRGAISSLVCGSDGSLWIGTLKDGLWRRHEGRFERFGAAEGLVQEAINSLYLDPDGVLWVGTVGSGLARFWQGRFKMVREEDGLADRTICGMAPDDQGNLWFTSLGGIFRVSRRELNDFGAGRIPRISSQRFDQQDGLATIQSTGSSQPKIARTPDGRMWFATMRGIASTDPAHLAMNTNPPPVVIERLRADGVEHLPGSSPTILPAGTRRVEVHYTALSLTAPSKVRFRHRLEDVGDTWSEVGGQRFASFDSLTPGRHNFRVIAANNDGVWNDVGASVAFTVLPYFWQTVWFRGAMGAVLLGGVGWGARFLSLIRVRRQLAAIDRQQAIDGERSRIARDMHDDVGSALTRLTLLTNQAVGDPSSNVPEMPILRQVTQLSREILGMLDELVWTVNPRHDSTTGLVDYLCHHAGESFREAGIRLRYNVAPGLAAFPVDSDVRHQVFLAFKESLTNILKHAGATEVWLRVRLDAGIIRIEVEDNGCGFDLGKSVPAHEGLSNMRQRLADVGGRCEITRCPGGGTRVAFLLPTKDSEGTTRMSGPRSRP
jgi:signal transduction histidine kinase/ligand-binding sensor domain-containing protein